MEADELETVLKLLRGSDKLSNVTYLCAFERSEVAKILQKTRPQQDTLKFIEKFFPVVFPLPEIDVAQLQAFFSQGIARILEGTGLDSSAKVAEGIWESGGAGYFQNLRRIKIFLNKISRALSLKPIVGEINIEDFLALELIRDIEPSLYVRIYRDHDRFWSRDLAFEVRHRGPYLSDDKAKEVRDEYYKQMMDLVPEEKHYVFRLLESIFPEFASYRNPRFTEAQNGPEAEKARHIFHPRCFRQHFVLKVPSELFPQREFARFMSSIESEGEGYAAEAFSGIFQSIAREDFKRWHFMHLIDNRFEETANSTARGLCRGMARNSGLWSTDAFELLIAVRSTRTALSKIVQRAARREFLRAIVKESVSDLYTLTLAFRLDQSFKVGPSEDVEVYRLKETEKAELLTDVQDMKTCIMEQLCEHYRIQNAPSVFEQFGHLGSGANAIEPNMFLFSWHRLGPDAASDQREYLLDLLTRRPKDLDHFLKLMFRVSFVDDYTTLKTLIDYKRLQELIARNEGTLDPEKVAAFRRRYEADSTE